MVKEQKNGLYLKLNDYELQYIQEYSPSWTPEYNTDNQFVNYDGTAINDNYKGTRYSASVTTGAMVEEDVDSLIDELKKVIIDFQSAPRNGNVEYTGKVKVNNYNKSVAAVTDKCRYYKVTFSVSAVGLEDSSGSL